MPTGKTHLTISRVLAATLVVLILASNYASAASQATPTTLSSQEGTCGVTLKETPSRGAVFRGGSTTTTLTITTECRARASVSSNTPRGDIIVAIEPLTTQLNPDEPFHMSKIILARGSVPEGTYGITQLVTVEAEGYETLHATMTYALTVIRREKIGGSIVFDCMEDLLVCAASIIPFGVPIYWAALGSGSGLDCLGQDVAICAEGIIPLAIPLIWVISLAASLFATTSNEVTLALKVANPATTTSAPNPVPVSTPGVGGVVAQLTLAVALPRLLRILRRRINGAPVPREPSTTQPLEPIPCQEC